ncbi:hypothetical protein [Nannocystis pusilla]|uniref:hypothetical protein n=1 Tax=Nannocystis pusilla TaxID=889268 RepID=UPI003B7C8BE4
MAWADGYLWIGQCYGARIHKVDATTGEVVKTLTSDRFVTGVTCVDGQLWHAAAGDDKPAELRRLGADGTPEEVLSVPVAMIAGSRPPATAASGAPGSGKIAPGPTQVRRLKLPP